jgi:hypothetical protein
MLNYLKNNFIYINIYIYKMDFKDKYLKYKNKYIRLKMNQNGGASNSILDFMRSDNRYIQDKVKQASFLTNSELDISDESILPFNEYSNLLSDLMNYGSEKSIEMGVIPDNELNLHFLNTISAFPENLRERLNIVKDGNYEDGKTKYKFIGDSNYEISGTISDGISGSKAIILNLNKINGHGSLPQDLVLKMIPINFNTYTNYTAISFQHISERKLRTPITDSRYYHYSREYYNQISFDRNYKGYNLINDEEQLHVTTSDLDDFKNEMVQNIICRQILGIDNKNLIKYYNYIYIEIEGIVYGGILMEQVDGSLNDYIKNTPDILTNDKFKNSLIRYINALRKLKNPINRFNHSDLKLQNIFYKVEGEELILKISDLDKSSITYNGIRFINNKLISKSFDYIRDKLSPFKLIDGNNGIIIPESLPGYGGIELEQIFLRYSFFPAPPFYDFLMLFICLKINFYDKIDLFLEYVNSPTSVSHLIDSFLGNGLKIIDITSSINDASQTLLNETDFGTIVFGTLISNKIPIPLVFKEDGRGDIVHNNLNLSYNLKLILTRDVIQYIIDQTVIKTFLQRSTTWKSQDGRNKIFYTGNVYPPTGRIVKTNRYAQKLPLVKPILYEWDYISR